MQNRNWQITREAILASSNVLGWRLVIFLLVLIGLFFINACFKWSLDTWWGDWADPLFGIFTFLLALWLLIGETRKNYLAELEKRLSVYFQTPNDSLIFYAHQVALTGEADIRQWGQQVGAQANFNPAKNGGKGGPEFLSFNSFFKITGPQTVIAPPGHPNRYLQHWTLTIFLEDGGYEFIKQRYDDKGISDHTEDILVLASPDNGKNQDYYWRSELLDPNRLPGNKIPLPEQLRQDILTVIDPYA